uniref:Glutathione S-transferase DHAR3 n=1 Tax=Schistocephalus solidus TaxID=70667 RepID=A0A0X3NM69_SCHSO
MQSDTMYHLKEGDLEPPVDPERLTLYDMQFCPYCQRVRYTLDYHGIPYDRVLIDLSSKPSWYLKMHPLGKVPLLLYRGATMAESDVIMKYVDQLKGAESSLLSVCGEEGFKSALNLASSVSLLTILCCRERVSLHELCPTKLVNIFLH